jgi:mycothiol synthase
MQSQRPKLPQIDMKFNSFESLPRVVLADGYRLATLEERSMDDWIEALNATGELGEWDRQKAREWLQGERHAIRAGTFFIIFEDRPVATACAIGPTSTETRPEFGWVSASPDHQGKGLGYQVSLAALLFIKELGYAETFLHTDDIRLPAIKTYLKLGFEPEITHKSHPERWQAVYGKLGISSGGMK